MVYITFYQFSFQMDRFRGKMDFCLVFLRNRALLSSYFTLFPSHIFSWNLNKNLFYFFKYVNYILHNKAEKCFLVHVFLLTRILLTWAPNFLSQAPCIAPGTFLGILISLHHPSRHSCYLWVQSSSWAVVVSESLHVHFGIACRRQLRLPGLVEFVVVLETSKVMRYVVFFGLCDMSYMSQLTRHFYDMCIQLSFLPFMFIKM